MAHAHLRAALLSIGDELTLGQTLDTNSKALASRLMDLGILPVEHVTVPDDLNAHVAALTRLASSVDILISTGGLGPTADDLTREALARASADTLIEDPVALEQITAWFGARGRTMPAINRLQALRPSRAVSLPNHHGTAPGLFATLTSGGRLCDVFCLPGPPGEMFPMFDAAVLPRLRPTPGRTVRTRVLPCFGIGESELATRLGDLMDRSRNPLVGTTASGGVVSCRIRYEGPLSPDEADAQLDAAERLIRDRAGPYLFGVGPIKLADAVLALLRERRHTVGVVESCTAGLLGSMLAEVPGASTAFRGGLLTYSNDLKSSLANVPPTLLAAGGPGAVSREVAAALAQGGLRTLGVDHALSVTGIAGPDGGTPAKPVGTVYVARASADGSTDVRRFAMRGDRQSIRDWSARCALAMLRLHLIGAGETKLLRQVDG